MLVIQRKLLRYNNKYWINRRTKNLVGPLLWKELPFRDVTAVLHDARQAAD